MWGFESPFAHHTIPAPQKGGFFIARLRASVFLSCSATQTFFCLNLELFVPLPSFFQRL